MVHFNHSIYRALCTAYPEHEFLPWKFAHVPKHYWTSRANLTRAMTWAGQQLKCKSFEDWYKVTRPMLARIGCKLYPSLLLSVSLSYRQTPVDRLTMQYHSIPALIMRAFPNHKWQPWMFRIAPTGLWRKRENVWEYFEWLKSELNITSMEGLYFITRPLLLKYKGQHHVFI